MLSFAPCIIIKLVICTEVKIEVIEYAKGRSTQPITKHTIANVNVKKSEATVPKLT